MKHPMFIKGQKLRVVSSVNDELNGIDIEVEIVHMPNTVTWSGLPNKESVYQFTHEGCSYGALESQLEPVLENHQSCGLSFETMLKEVKRSING